VKSPGFLRRKSAAGEPRARRRPTGRRSHRRLVALNAERADEEKTGFVRWLRPDYQNPASGKAAESGKARKLESKFAG